VLKRSVFKDNIFRLAKDSERAVFLDRVKHERRIDSAACG
jgi:hypothetical protein